MMYTCAAALNGRVASAAKTLKRSTAKTVKRATVKTVKRPQGGSLRVDIHCHYLNPQVAAEVAHLNPAEHPAAPSMGNTPAHYHHLPCPGMR